MKYETAFISAPVPVTILTTHGDIDASNYLELIGVVRKLYQDGMRNLLIDMGDTLYISSSGLVALHSIALILSGGKPLNVEDGWNALRSMAEGPGSFQTHLKLLHVQPRVERTLDLSGVKAYYEMFTDRDAALASFPKEKAAPTAP